MFELPFLSLYWSERPTATPLQGFSFSEHFKEVMSKRPSSSLWFGLIGHPEAAVYGFGKFKKSCQSKRVAPTNWSRLGSWHTTSLSGFRKFGYSCLNNRVALANWSKLGIQYATSLRGFRKFGVSCQSNWVAPANWFRLGIWHVISTRGFTWDENCPSALTFLFLRIDMLTYIGSRVAWIMARPEPNVCIGLRLGWLWRECTKHSLKMIA